ncbi:hypothetical protein H9645_05320 [Luteimonas sp. Sa2BVA3]|uniref:Uncharacterized protein n=1 Tax=Luteimonas colneyensis TaxID=2762230 RepID=A0ABR8UHE2_9GAMM|nr:DUF5677 domain-containing protein [Luteimonas colneyensis]MBD7987444.1 hypothetical protein [Luteimonas colneyensis]
MESNVEAIAEDLMLRSGAMSAGASMDAKDKLHPEIDAFVRESLKAGSELMSSCASLAVGPHELAVNVLVRSIIELSLKLHWATLSSDNAKHLLALSTEQVKTIFRVNARTGIAKIVDRQGNDFTAEFLASGRAERGQKQVSLEAMAQQSGLHGIYNLFYRFQSMHSHGNNVSGSSALTTTNTLGVVGVFSILLGHLGVRWLVHRSRPDNEEIRSLLGLGANVHP